MIEPDISPEETLRLLETRRHDVAEMPLTTNGEVRLAAAVTTAIDVLELLLRKGQEAVAMLDAARSAPAPDDDASRD